MDGRSPNRFKEVHMKQIPVVEDLLPLNNLLYDIDIVDGNIIWQLARRSVQNYENTVRLLRYNNHLYYEGNIIAVFHSFRCPNCDTFFKSAVNLEWHLSTCREWVKNVFPNNVYQIRETLFHKLDSIVIMYKSEEKLFKNLAIFHFEFICVHEQTFKEENTRAWIGKHIPMSVSNSSNFVEEPVFLCNSDLHHLVASFNGALENLASKSQTKKKLVPRHRDNKKT